MKHICITFVTLVGLLGVLPEPGLAEKKFYSVPSFTLIDSQGKKFSSASMHGNVWVANFIFTSCDGICPTVSAHLAKLVQEHKNSSVHFVSISVDPETDTPERLRQFAAKYKADPNKWHFLTGKKETVHEVIRGHLRTSLGAKPMLHSTQFVLIDQIGNISGKYEGLNDDQRRKLSKDITNLLIEP